jgi:hypothetical protein
MISQEDRDILERFALDHKLILEERGEVGFWRPCVGYLKGESYVDYTRRDDLTFEYLPGFDGEGLWAPEGVNAYHKCTCLAVLVDNDDYDEALKQLAVWVRALNEVGVEVIRYERQHDSLVGVVLHGLFGYCLRVKD